MPERTVSVSQGRPDAYEQLLREIQLTKENFETRLDALDKATVLLQSRADRVPQIETVAANMLGLRELHGERFSSIETQFKERDTALSTTLSATKEAIIKSEIAFTKQLDQIGLQIQTILKAVEDKISDVKERITVIESRTEGIANNKQETRDDSKHIWGIAFGIGGFALALGTMISVILK